MKKKLLLIVLALAILTSLTAGTLAVYTRNIEMDDETVAAKRFACAAAGDVDSDTGIIKLAPSESMNYVYTVYNYDLDEEGNATGSPAEVDLRFAVSFNFADAYKAMSGLKAELKDSTGQVVATNDEGALTYNGAVLNKDKEASQAYTLTLTWVDNGQNASHTGSGEAETSTTLTVDVVATQEI